MKMLNVLSATLMVVLLSFALIAPVQAAPNAFGLDVSPDSNCFVARNEPGCDDAECEAAVAASDAFCTDVAWDGICVGGAFNQCTLDTLEGIAQFGVSKIFSDGNPMSVEVDIVCTGGLPLTNAAEISQERGVAFVLEAFTDGQPTCTVSEVVPAGYQAVYGGNGTVSEDGCVFENVVGGESYVCTIRNESIPVGVEVEAVWDSEVSDNGVPEQAFASMSCTDTAFGTSSFAWTISGDYTFTASIFPDYDGGTVCNVVYGSLVSAVEGMGCDDPISVTQDGGDQSCTITFTSFFEGIPTINQYGLAILAVLMLSIGVVGFRRFV